MEKLVNTIVNWLIQQGAVSVKDKSIYCYGMEVLLSSIITYSSIIIIAYLADRLLETIVFSIAFVCLRQYAGGHHAKTRWGCYCLSLSAYLIYLALITFIPFEMYKWTSILSAFFATVLVFWQAPVIHENRRISLSEKKHYRKLSRMICIGELLVVIVGSYIWESNLIILSIALGILFAACSLKGLKCFH